MAQSARPHNLVGRALSDRRVVYNRWQADLLLPSKRRALILLYIYRYNLRAAMDAVVRPESGSANNLAGAKTWLSIRHDLYFSNPIKRIMRFRARSWASCKIIAKLTSEMALPRTW
jgi:hypothetical protein